MRREKILPLLIPIIIPLVALAPLWINAHAMVFDMADYFLPQRYFLGECLRNGVFPWWNPYSGLGIPFHADPQSGVFYPIAWLIGFVFGYNFYTINCEYLLHLMIAGWGMYLLMFSITKSKHVSLCVAVAYQLCGVFIGNAQHLTWIISAAWLPWVIFYWKKTFTEGRTQNAVTVALCLMMMTTGGYPAFIIELLYGVIICSVIFIVKKIRDSELRSLKKFLQLNLLIGGCYLLITAPYIVSFIEAIPYFTRGVPFKTDPSVITSFTPQSTLSFLFPAATLGNSAFFHSDISMINAYIGLLPFVFLIALFISKQTRLVWILFFTSCLLLLISFGGDFLAWKFLFDYAPLFNYIHFASSFRLLAMLGFLITAGMVMNNPETYSKAIRASIILLTIIVGAAVISYLNVHQIILPKNFSATELKAFYNQSTVANNIILQSVFQALVMLAFIFIFLRRKRLSEVRFYSLLLIMVCADMLIATQFNSRVTVFGMHDVHSLNKKLDLQPKGFSISLDKNVIDITHEGDGTFSPSYYNNNLFTKEFAQNSYNPFLLKNKDSLRHSPFKKKLLNHPLAFISIRPQIYPKDFDDSTSKVDKDGVIVSEKFFQAFSNNSCDSLQKEISVLDFNPNKFSFATKTSCNSVFTLLQNYYPGWKATINGAAVPIEISNYSTMSVPLSVGANTITFEYDPKIVRWLLWLSIVSQVAIVIFLFVSRRKAITS